MESTSNKIARFSFNEKMLMALIALAITVLAFGFSAYYNRSPAPSPVGASAEAVMVSPNGTEMGTVSLVQGQNGVVLAFEVRGLSPGGHAQSINSVGACSPDFETAGDHFHPEESRNTIIHSAWNKITHLDPHAGDLPNIYASAEGSARADFYAKGITLEPGRDHSVFDTDGSSIIIYGEPTSYLEESSWGDRVACGVIRQN